MLNFPFLPWRRFLLSLALTQASAFLLWLSFFPVNCGWLAWFALVPLLWVALSKKAAAPALAGGLGGLSFALLALRWLALASLPLFWVGLALVFFVHAFVFVLLLRRFVLRGRLPVLLAAPALWISLELLRARIDVGFPWYFLGHTQHDCLALIQIADLFGTYGVSALVMMANVAVLQTARALLARRLVADAERPSWLSACRPVLLVLVLLGVSLAYGASRLGLPEATSGPRIALLQGTGIRSGNRNWEAAVEELAGLCDEAAHSRPDLIVWPETSFPDLRLAWQRFNDGARLPLRPTSANGAQSEHWLSGQFGADAWIRLAPALTAQQVDRNWSIAHAISARVAESAARHWRTSLVLGINALIREPEATRRYNSALVLDPKGQEIGRYDKQYRLPFGEYVPYKDTFPFLKRLAAGDRPQHTDSGVGGQVFVTPGTGHRFAVLLCYEDTVPHLAPEYLRRSEAGRGPDFFLTLGNEGDFSGPEEHEQHLAIVRFRAIECRRAMARAVNTGISAVIDGNGRVVAAPCRSGSGSQASPAVVLAGIPIDRRWSFYACTGDLLPWLGLGTCLALLITRPIRKVLGRGNEHS